MEPEDSLLYSQGPATCPCPEPYLSSPHLLSYFFNIHFHIILPSTPESFKWSLSLRFLHQNPHKRHSAWPEKYVSIRSDSQAALKCLQAAKTTSPLVQQCQKALNISTQHSVRLFQVTGHSQVHGNETADELPSRGTVHQFAGSEPGLDVSRQNIRKNIKCWMDNQHMAMWQGLSSTHRQAWNLISGPSPTVKTRPLSFNRMQSTVVTGLLTGHNTLRRHLYIMWLTDST